MARIGLLAALFAFVVGAWADPLPGHFFISLTGFTQTSFTATANQEAPSGFSNTLAVSCSDVITCADPDIELDLGGTSTQVGNSFTFSNPPDANGYQNIGTDWNSLLITTDLAPGVYTCDTNSSLIFPFATCGFAEDVANQRLEIFFTDGKIPSALPEPGLWSVLLMQLAGAVMMISRMRRWGASNV